MTKNTLLLALAAVVLLGGGVWLGSTNKVEAPTETGTITLAPTNGEVAPPTTTEGAPIENPGVNTAPAPTPKQTTPTAAPKPVSSTPSTPTYALVIYDGNGFSPKEVTILKGGRIRFLNTSSEEMWVASDFHPSHKSYPVTSKNDCLGSSFDMCKSVEKNGYWEFVFNEQGTWRYHNHMKASMNGSVEVNTRDEKPSIPGN